MPYEVLYASQFPLENAGRMVQIARAGQLKTRLAEFALCEFNVESYLRRAVFGMPPDAETFAAADDVIPVDVLDELSVCCMAVVEEFTPVPGEERLAASADAADPTTIALIVQAAHIVLELIKKLRTK